MGSARVVIGEERECELGDLSRLEKLDRMDVARIIRVKGSRPGDVKGKW